MWEEVRQKVAERAEHFHVDLSNFQYRNSANMFRNRNLESQCFQSKITKNLWFHFETNVVFGKFVKSRQMRRDHTVMVSRTLE